MLREGLRHRVVLVKEAGGSIGSELCRQIARFGPRELALAEQAENALFLTYRELSASFPRWPSCPPVSPRGVVAGSRDRSLARVLSESRQAGPDAPGLGYHTDRLERIHAYLRCLLAGEFQRVEAEFPQPRDRSYIRQAEKILGLVDRKRLTAAGRRVAECDLPEAYRLLAEAFENSEVGKAWLHWARATGLHELRRMPLASSPTTRVSASRLGTAGPRRWRAC